MKMGFVSAILADLSFEDVVAFAAAEGFDCVEMMCWPRAVGGADQDERRYAGVTHVDVGSLTAEGASRLKSVLKTHGVEISSLGYYPNPLDPDPEKRRFFADHLIRLIDASALMGIGMVTTFVGRDKNKSVDENLAEFRKVWPPLIAHAESKKVRVAIENCPMLFSGDEWPGGLNLATTPAVWRQLFAAIPSASFGLNYDPSHLVWQMMDTVKPIYEFRDRLFHIHYKDVRVYKDKLDEVGILATPLQYMAPKLPGLGDIDWGAFVAALNDVGYQGSACIEVEDRAFEGSLEERKNATVLSRRYLKQFTV